MADPMHAKILLQTRIITKEKLMRILTYKRNMKKIGELSELERYLSDNQEPSYESFDLLDWWKTNKAKYCILGKIARDVVVVAVSIVASESTFSTWGRVLDLFRSSLSPKRVQALVCTQNWIWGVFNKTAKVCYEDVLQEIEDLEEIQNSKISDIF
uniref:HAT C-terminal dimerisation domain-containing protein n=1 Tax=Lactuca sativa TaxID=4236 RepID=A0A9R1X3N4_LACSA|nr:hypothetical protein LSAT_V11C700382320 [Lactuca sativa]